MVAVKKCILPFLLVLLCIGLLYWVLGQRSKRQAGKGPGDSTAHTPDKLIGEPAPELRKIKGWKNGGPVRISDFRGKYVLLDFWGYWCGPCVMEMPTMMELHDVFSDEGLVIIAVHDDSLTSIEELDSKLEWLRQKHWGGRRLPFMVALDGGGNSGARHGATTAAYGITGWPTKVLIGPSGKVLEKRSRIMPPFLDKLRQLLLDASPGKPEWKERFDLVYRLEAGETLRWVRPPFIPERTKFFAPLRIRSDFSMSEPVEFDHVPESNLFLWNGREAKDYWVNPTTLERLLKALGLTAKEIRGPFELLDLKLHGDWILRKESTTERRLKELSQILKKEFSQSISFSKQRIEEQVVVAHGQLNLQPIKHKEWEAQALRHFPELPKNYPVFVYTDSLDGVRFRILYADTHLSGLLQEVAELLHQPIVDETESSDIVVGWAIHHSVRREAVLDEPTIFDSLLENLAKQTSLEFTREKRASRVWVVSGHE